MTGVMWTYAATGARLVLQIGLTAILARLLGPVPFGIVGMALAVVGFVGLLVDQGLTAALIQRPELTAAQIRVAFTRLLLASLAAAAACALGATAIASFFREPALAAPMAVLSAAFIPAALSSVSVALLRRQLRIRALQIVNVAAYATGYGLLALPMALAGYGLWSLVAASLCHLVLMAIAYYALTRHPTGLLWGGTAGLSRFGTRAASAGLLSWFTETFPGMIIGRALGAAQLGVFNAAFNLARTPATAIATGGLEMLFASSARADQSATFRQRALRTGLGLVGLVSLPAFATLALVPETLVIVLYGPRWTDAMPLLPPLALAMPALMLSGVAGAMLAAMGRPGRDLLSQALAAALVAAGVLAAIGHSTLAVAWVICGAMCARMLISLLMASRLVGLNARDVAAALMPGIVLAMVVAPLVNALDSVLSHAQVHRALVLAADAAAGGALLVAGVAALRGLIQPETRWAIGQALRRVPFGLTARLAPYFEAGAATP
jgi:O-antigen/teichoic acid export membrane protein